MNAPLAPNLFAPSWDGKTPLPAYYAKAHALADLRAEFEEKYRALCAEFSARKARIEREHW